MSRLEIRSLRGEQIKVGPPGRGDLISLSGFIEYLIHKGVINEEDLIDYADAKNVAERMSRNG